MKKAFAGNQQKLPAAVQRLFLPANPIFGETREARHAKLERK